MRKALLEDVGKLVILEQDTPHPGPDEVLIRVKVCGICGSDVHIFRGQHPVIRPPVVLGHEIVGVVEEVGRGATDIEVGDRVLVIPGVGCGSCPACVTGHFNRCPNLRVIGGHLPGGLADCAIVPANQVIRLPDSISDEEGSLVEATAVAVHSALRLGDVRGLDVVVFGAGPVGLLTLQVLEAFGARRVAITDISEGRLLLAQRIGAKYLINAGQSDPVEYVRHNLHPEGADAAVDCAGKEATLRQALEATKNGAVIALTAIFDRDPLIPMRWLQRGERELRGVQMYLRPDVESAIRLVAERRVRTGELITHRYPLSDVQNAFHTAAGNVQGAGKVVVIM